MTEPAPPPAPPTAPAPPAPELARDQQWQRLDPRMLLVHPIRELVRFLPVLVAVVVAGASGGAEAWQLIGVALPVALGLLRYLTTSFRIAAGRIELRRGLLNRHVLSTPVDRVRTVDLTSSPVHRVLGLTTVRIGTGVTTGEDEERLDLDGLPVGRARELRRELLRRGEQATDATVPEPGAVDQAVPVVRLDPSWVRFAPLTGTGVVIAAAALGAMSQLLNSLGAWGRVDPGAVADRGAGLPVAVLVVLGLVGAAVVFSLLAVGGYLASYWGFALTRQRGVPPAADTWHTVRGLLTTRETSLDDGRVAGVTLSEPLGLRLARGARLSAIVTGLDRRQRGSAALVPPAPRSVVASVATAVLDTAEPVTGPLVPHGPRATRRRWIRALGPAVVLAAACVAGVVAGAGDWLLVGLVAVPVGAGLAADRARSLGHALVAGHLVARSGSLGRRQRALGVEHVIGWTLRATWWQRRAGLTTLVATTAGGPQAVSVLDVPEDEAVAVAAAALPGLVDQFRADQFRA